MPFTLSDSKPGSPVCDGTGRAIDYLPWNVSTGGIIAFDLKQINDTFSTLGNSCGKSYNTYRTTTHATAATASRLHPCASGYCRLGYQFFPTSNLVTVIASERQTDANKIIVDEAGVLGAVAFFAWFLGIYVIGIDDEEDIESTTCEQCSPEDTHVEGD